MLRSRIFLAHVSRVRRVVGDNVRRPWDSRNPRGTVEWASRGSPSNHAESNPIGSLRTKKSPLTDTGSPSYDTQTNPIADACRELGSLRTKKSPLTDSEISTMVDLLRKFAPRLNEKQLSLSLSLLLNPANYRPDAVEGLVPVVKTMIESFLRNPGQLTLQGCNQIIGGFGKLVTKRTEINIDEYRSYFDSIIEIFVSRFLADSPNRELSNIFWAASVIGNIDQELMDALVEAVTRNISEFDCCDLSLVCAGIMGVPDHALWPVVRQDLLSRKRFTEKDIGSLMCSLACTGINDRELILHMASVIHRTGLLTVSNLPAVVWALATCDSLYIPIMDHAVELIHAKPDAITDAMNIRRISRGFAITGQLGRIEEWLVEKVISSSSESIADSLLIWELCTNGLGPSALKLFRNRSSAFWETQLANSDLNASQLYHLYLTSLIDESVALTEDEREYLKSLQSRFALKTDDMSSSVLHRQASDAVKKLKYEHVSEYQEPVTGYMIDIYIPSINVGIEVQGPSHFVTDIETGASVLRPADIFKHKVLRKVSGMRVVQATPWNFGPKVNTRNEVLMRALIDNKPVGKRRPGKKAAAKLVD